MKYGVEGDCNEHGRREMHTENWRGILKERAHMEDLKIDSIIY
jgi:hypothetical protein